MTGSSIFRLSIGSDVYDCFFSNVNDRGLGSITNYRGIVLS